MVSAEFYRQRANHFQTQTDQLEKTIQQHSFARLIVAIVVLILIYFGFQEPIYFLPAALLGFLFLYLVQRQQKKEKEKEIAELSRRLNAWEEEAIDYDFQNFPNGKEFVDPQHSYSHDLDLFGDESLFQYLNRCATRLGENELANNLTRLRFKKEEIVERQLAIRELGSQLEFRQLCWATGKQIQDSKFNLEPLLIWLRQSNLFYSKNFFMFLQWSLPIITCSALIGMIFLPELQFFFIPLGLLQLGITSYYNKPITKLQEELSRYRVIMENYSRLFDLLSKQVVKSKLLISHQQIAKEATDHVHELSKLINAIESRANMIARMFGNGLFMYDFHTVTKLEDWRNKYSSDLPHWLESMAEWDALTSFSTFHYNNPNYAFAEIDEQLIIDGKEIGHPLIRSKVRVTNDFSLGNPANVMLVTGANMAGKSTFLRAIGVNCILALNGAPVCASQWKCSVATLRTGMRTTDSLKDHESYFYAELNRLQSIIEELRARKPVVILLDEILKGTNSNDKLAGSRELIKQFIDKNALVLIATHDILLGDMETQYPNHILNTCFEGRIENDQLTFDYKLNRGLAQRANATFLMKKMGIIPHE